MEKVKNFQQNYLESEKFFSKFSYFLERENFQNLKVMEIMIRELSLSVMLNMTMTTTTNTKTKSSSSSTMIE